jgi:secreted trypsin-like serine protease
MKKIVAIPMSLFLAFSLMSLVVRHDVSDAKFIALGKEYPQICHLQDGEATLIKEDWVVTAAHAAAVLQDEIEVGQVPQISINKKSYEVEKVVLHPKFEMSLSGISNDIALIRIKGSITEIPYAQLYDQEDEKGKYITIVGRGDFGTGQTGPKKRDMITRAATNKIDRVKDQWIIYTFDGPDSDNTTALEGVSGPGDSGGPAFIDIDGVRYIIGVSSHQRDYGQEGVYGVSEYYARISYFKSWIEKTIN